MHLHAESGINPSKPTHTRKFDLLWDTAAGVFRIEVKTSTASIEKHKVTFVHDSIKPLKHDAG